MNISQAPAPTLGPQRAVAGTLAALACVAGLLLAIYWSYEFVDDVIGHGVASALLGEDAKAGATVLGSLAMAVVTGLAGTFTACNVACFASLGPVANLATGHRASRLDMVRHTAVLLGWLTLGMLVTATLYGVFIAVMGDSSPMLSDATVGAFPVRLAQASIINVALGVGLLVVAWRYLSGHAITGARGLIGLGALLGLLIVGRPFPMFREVLEDAASTGNLVKAVALMALVVLGNIALLAILMLGAMTLFGPNLQRWSAAHPSALARGGGFLLMIMGAFSLFYWGLRVPHLVAGVGWFPTP